MNDFYRNSPEGLTGNDDCGQMSAWYVLSAMGFYPVCPGQKEYAIGTPLFNTITINLENGKQFIIKSENVSENNIYIQFAKFNNKIYTKCYINHDDIMAGGLLELTMGPNPNLIWGTGIENIPHSAIKDYVLSPKNQISEDSRIIQTADWLIKHAKNNIFLCLVSMGILLIILFIVLRKMFIRG